VKLILGVAKYTNTSPVMIVLSLKY